MILNGTHPRIANELSDILPEKELHSLDARRAVTRALNRTNGETLDFRNSDDSDFRDKVTRHYSLLKGVDPSQHILFRGIEDRRLVNLMLEESLHWDIESPIPLNPAAAQAILELYQGIDNLPLEVHKKLFPLTMTGYLLGHNIRVGIYAAILMEAANAHDPEKYNISPEKVARAGALHDIGKNDKMQRQTSRLPGEFSSPTQYFTMKLHPAWGRRAIDTLNESGCSPIPKEDRGDVRDAAHFHHVRPDDDPVRSYPKGMPYAKISHGIRAISIADAFDTMTTRGYILQKHGRSHIITWAREELAKCRGSQFDPELVDIFLRMNIRPIKTHDLQ
jgi:HD-GYP domain-containing protein (c-di-GMP phosphodiesterase class II)